MQMIQTTTNPRNAATVGRPSAASFDASGALEKLLALGSPRIVREGAAIHRAGDELRSLYFVKTGVAKRVLLQEDGREQILGFPLPGEILGLEAIGSDRHSSTVVALDLCAIVEIPFAELERLLANDPDVAKAVYRLIAAALREEHGWLAAQGLLTAEERVAAFLLDLSRRYTESGCSGSRFVLRMTRAAGRTDAAAALWHRLDAQRLGAIAVGRNGAVLHWLAFLQGRRQGRAGRHRQYGSVGGAGYIGRLWAFGVLAVQTRQPRHASPIL